MSNMSLKRYCFVLYDNYLTSKISKMKLSVFANKLFMYRNKSFLWMYNDTKCIKMTNVLHEFLFMGCCEFVHCLTKVF